MLGVSERFACRVAGQHRATQRHEPASVTPKDPDAALRAWLRAHARAHPRRGFRAACHDARGEGWIVNHKKIQRLWRDEGLRVPQRRWRKRRGTSIAIAAPSADDPNTLWAIDFQFDLTTDGRSIKIVSIIDEHTRECLGGVVARSITGEDLITELNQLGFERGTHPAVLRCDNGPELACEAMADWAGERVGLHFIPPGERLEIGHGGHRALAWMRSIARLAGAPCRCRRATVRSASTSGAVWPATRCPVPSRSMQNFLEMRRES